VNPAKKPMAEKFGMTDFVNPTEVEGDLVPYLVDLTKGGADYTFDATGNVQVMRAALESAHKGWGESIIIGVAPAGAEISTRPFQLVTGGPGAGTAFGGARGRTDVPKIVDWYMEGKIEIDPMITHTMPLDDINKGFELMHSGESIRSVVLVLTRTANPSTKGPFHMKRVSGVPSQAWVSALPRPALAEGWSVTDFDSVADRATCMAYSQTVVNTYRQRYNAPGFDGQSEWTLWGLRPEWPHASTRCSSAPKRAASWRPCSWSTMPTTTTPTRETISDRLGVIWDEIVVGGGVASGGVPRK
jgi:hypothetical protein